MPLSSVGSRSRWRRLSVFLLCKVYEIFYCCIWILGEDPYLSPWFHPWHCKTNEKDEASTPWIERNLNTTAMYRKSS